MRIKALAAMGVAATMVAGGAPALAQDKPLTERNETVESAVATPVEDLNIKKTKIPDSLQRAQANPYDLTSVSSCEAIAVELAQLNEALGDDYDDLAVAQQTKDEPKGPSAGALLKAGVAQAIPFRGLVRQLSGAAQHEKAVDDAIDAGFARRGFLKGRALEMNCAPPASPAWYTPKPDPAPMSADVAAASSAPAAPASVQTDLAAAPGTAVGVEAATSAPAEGASTPRPAVEVAALPQIAGANEAAPLAVGEPVTIPAAPTAPASAQPVQQ